MSSDAGDDRFDAVLDRLRGVVERLEQGNLPLEDSLRTFEEGIALARRGHVLLDEAERRVELLAAGGEAGEARVVPFPGEPSP